MSLVLRNVSKHYGVTQALNAVDIKMDPGEIHTLVGENGAGKSTALGVLAGRVQADSGRVLLDGEECHFSSPRDAMATGVRAIFQELSVIPNLTVLENVFIAHGSPHLWERRQRRRLVDQFEALVADVGFQVTPAALAGRLSLADQQMVEILRAMVGEPYAVLFDEPSATLGPHERESLYRVLGALRDRGVVVGLVSHSLPEVLELSDKITVFRDGQVVASGAGASWTREALTEAMVGEVQLCAAPHRSATVASPPVIAVSELTVGSKLTAVTLEVNAGEIVGIAGLVGAGRSTLLRTLAGAISPTSGHLSWRGVPTEFPATVRHARKLGIVLVPEDRKDEGLIPERSVASNIALGDLRAVSRFGLVRRRRMREVAETVSATVGFDPGRLEAPVVTLSGGNQQKVLVARALGAAPRLLLVDEPTRGVDVLAKAEIHRTVAGAAADGAAVVVVSSEFEDLVELCHRVLVMWKGRIVADLVGADLSTDLIVKKSFGPEELC